jgi:hypothetical protein
VKPDFTKLRATDLLGLRSLRRIADNSALFDLG